jgi:hypothetical protein
MFKSQGDRSEEVEVYMCGRDGTYRVPVVLKGQCNELLVEMSPWTKQNGRRLFFLFKNRPSQCNGPYNSPSMYVKTGPPDPADFATTRHLIHWRFLALRAMVWAIVGISRTSHYKKIRHLPAVAYREMSLGISRCDVRDMPTLGPTIARSATVGKLDAES